MRIGELAQLAGLKTSAIRYYEAERLLPAPRRVSGRRDYDRDALVRLQLVAAGQKAGFAIREIRDLVKAVDQGQRLSAAWHVRAHRKLEELERTMEQIEVARRFLRESLACGCDRLDDCRLLRDGRR